MNNTLIILGSARPQGETYQAVKLFTKIHPHCDIINLSDYQINNFCYEKRWDDDFMLVFKKLLSYKNIIFATPVYWYTMSTTMKCFVDRLTDIMIYEEPLLQELAKKNLAVIATYATYPEGKDGFEQIFKNIAQYFGMHYQHCFFYYTGEDQPGIAENTHWLAIS